MIIGVPREIKTQEYRVALTPAGADGLVRAGHRVMVQDGAVRWAQNRPKYMVSRLKIRSSPYFFISFF
jgi:alanine dehydrogenase